MQDVSIEELGLSVRTFNCLRNSRNFFLSQIMCLTENDMKKIKNMGSKSIGELLNLQKIMKEDLVKEIEFLEINEDDNRIEIIDICMIHKAFPQSIGKKIGKVIFKRYDGTIDNDILVKELGLSIRTTNALLVNGYESIKKVAFEKYEVIKSIKNMGRQSIDELITFIRNWAEITLEGDCSNSEVEQVLSQMKKVFENKRSQFDTSYISKAVRTNLANNQKKYCYERNVSELLNDNEFVKDILFQENVEKPFSNYIFSIIQKKGKLVEVSSLEEELPVFFAQNNFLERCISRLIAAEKIEKINGKFRVKLPCVSEWIQTLKGSQKIAVSLRLTHTLEECGKELGVTRERARQIVSKALNGKPILREDDYAYWYENYLLDKESMNIVFEENENTYNYLKMTYKRGEKNVEDMTNDPQLTKEIYINLQKYIHRNSIFIDGEYVLCKRDLLCRKLAQSVCSESDISFDEFYEKYMCLLKEHGLETNEKFLFSSKRSFEARLSDKLYILSKYGRKFRYYPIEEYDIVGLVQELRFERFKNVEISTLKLFMDNKEVMQEYGILDEYELHNLLKKTQNEWNENNIYDVELTRMPLMTFGSVDRKEQAEYFLFQIAPVSVEEYCQLYEMEYGVLARTVLANMTSYISNYYHEGQYTINQLSLEDDEIQYLSEYLDGDFYFIDDIKNVFAKQFIHADLNKINTRTLKELGFKVFTDYVIRNTFSSADEYFRSVYMANDLLDLNKQDSRLVYIQASNNALDNLKSSYALIEYEDKKYIKYSHLISVVQNLDKEMINHYVDRAITYAGDEEFFTVKKLMNDGFDDELHHIGLDEWFNSSLLKNSKKIRFIKTGGGVIFSKKDSRFTTVDFIRYIMKSKKKMYIEDFLDFLLDLYGIKLQREKIIWLIKNSDLYYDSIMEKVYLKKEYYYDEI